MASSPEAAQSSLLTPRGIIAAHIAEGFWEHIDKASYEKWRNSVTEGNIQQHTTIGFNKIRELQEQGLIPRDEELFSQAQIFLNHSICTNSSTDIPEAVLKRYIHRWEKSYRRSPSEDNSIAS